MVSTTFAGPLPRRRTGRSTITQIVSAVESAGSGWAMSVIGECSGPVTVTVTTVGRPGARRTDVGVATADHSGGLAAVTDDLLHDPAAAECPFGAATALVAVRWPTTSPAGRPHAGGSCAPLARSRTR